LEDADRKVVLEKIVHQVVNPGVNAVSVLTGAVRKLREAFSGEPEEKAEKRQQAAARLDSEIRRLRKLMEYLSTWPAVHIRLEDEDKLVIDAEYHDFVGQEPAQRKRRGGLISKRRIRKLIIEEVTDVDDEIEAFKERRIAAAGHMTVAAQVKLLRILSVHVFGDPDAVCRLKLEHFNKPIPALADRVLSELRDHYRRLLRKSDSGLGVLDFMLESLGIPNSLSWDVENWLETIRRGDVSNWEKVPVQAQREAIMLLAEQLDIPVSWLYSKELEEPVAALGDRSLQGMYLYYRKLKKELEERYPRLAEMEVIEFIQLRLGLPTMRRVKYTEQIKALYHQRGMAGK
jgi:hypothetical protein